MKSFVVTAAFAGVIASAALGFAGAAQAAPAGPATADRVVSELQSKGFHVILNKFGTHSLAQCTVSSVRPQTLSRMDTGAPGAQDDIVTTVTSMVAFVDVVC